MLQNIGGLKKIMELFTKNPSKKALHLFVLEEVLDLIHQSKGYTLALLLAEAVNDNGRFCSDGARAARDVGILDRRRPHKYVDL